MNFREVIYKSKVHFMLDSVTTEHHGSAIKVHSKDTQETVSETDL